MRENGTMGDEPEAFDALTLSECAAREVAKRRGVYPRLVAEGKMGRHFADEQIAMMEQITREYARKAQTEGLLGRMVAP